MRSEWREKGYYWVRLKSDSWVIALWHGSSWNGMSGPLDEDVIAEVGKIIKPPA